MIYHSLFSRAFALYLLVGLLNTFFGYTVFALLIFLDVHYAVAVFLSTTLGVLFNFRTTGGIVFKNKNNSLIFRFFSVYFFVYIVNVFCLKIYRYFDDNLYFAGLLMILPSAILTFLLLRQFVFKENVAKCQ